jgi:hypothetical protein
MNVDRLLVLAKTMAFGTNMLPLHLLQQKQAQGLFSRPLVKIFEIQLHINTFTSQSLVTGPLVG